MSAGVGLGPSSSASSALRAARRVRAQFRFSFDGQEDDLVRVPAGNVTRLVQQLAGVVTSRVLQITPLSPHRRPGSTFSDVVWQSLADDTHAQVEVHRLYLIPPGATPPKLRRSGKCFEEKSASISDFIEAEWKELPIACQWLIDDSVVVSEETDDLPHWRVSARQSDVKRFQEMWHRLWDRADSELARPDPFTEPLVRSADTMATIAKMSCSGHMYINDPCSWYHGVWQHLRLFDLVSSPAWHASFYHEELNAALRRFGPVGDARRRPRILITGAADYSMLAYVLHAAEQVHTPVDVRVVDLCRTPLIACQWYAQQSAVRVDAVLPSGEMGVGAAGTSRVSVCEMDFRDAGQSGTGLGSGYDLITTDAFLTRFKPAEARQVVKAWCGLLEPGASVVTTVRVHPLDAPRGGILDEVSDFVLRARDRAVRWRPYVAMGLDELTTAARRYAMQMRSHDLGDTAAIRELFTAAGFEITAEKLGRVPGELRPATYLRIVGRKR